MNEKKHLPSVDQLLRSLPPELYQQYGRHLITGCVRAELAAARESVRHGLTQPDHNTLCTAICHRAATLSTPNITTVFNLTGTILHTNLGRALLAEEAITLMIEAARFPCALEYNLQTGKRGDRDELVSDLLTTLVAPDNADIAATIVNNNAAAVLLTLNTLAQSKEAIVSRGELIEIGGAFRIPDVMRRAQVKLVEIGTTNRTHAHDYTEAITPRTALIMKVHTSNYQIKGFTAAVSDKKVAEIAHAASLPCMIDLGSGTLTDFTQFGLPHEPTPMEALAAGADIVTFSGDKLLGGPQAGLIVGKKAIIHKIKKNPLKRALRVGKITLAALEATLRLYQNPDRLKERLPTLRFLARPVSEISATGARLFPLIQAAIAPLPLSVTLEACRSQIGSGALPVESLDSIALVFRPNNTRSSKALLKLEARFRNLPTPILGYIKNDAYHLDLRCLETKDEEHFIRQLAALTR